MFFRCVILFIRKRQSICQILFGRYSIILWSKRKRKSFWLLTAFPNSSQRGLQNLPPSNYKRVLFVGQKTQAYSFEAGPGFGHAWDWRWCMGEGEHWQVTLGSVLPLCMNLALGSTGEGSSEPKERERLRGSTTRPRVEHTLSALFTHLPHAHTCKTSWQSALHLSLGNLMWALEVKKKKKAGNLLHIHLFLAPLSFA